MKSMYPAISVQIMSNPSAPALSSAASPGYGWRVASGTLSPLAGCKGGLVYPLVSTAIGGRIRARALAHRALAALPVTECFETYHLIGGIHREKDANMQSAARS